MADVCIGFAACWAIGTGLMFRMTGTHLTTDSAAIRLVLSLAWPVVLWKEGR